MPNMMANNGGSLQSLAGSGMMLPLRRGRGRPPKIPLSMDASRHIAMA